MLTCSICGCAYLPAGRWHNDWCPGCAVNFSQSQELRLQGGQPTARQVLEAAVATPLTPRQRTAMERLHAHWEAEAQRRLAEEEAAR